MVFNLEEFNGKIGAYGKIEYIRKHLGLTLDEFAWIIDVDNTFGLVKDVLEKDCTDKDILSIYLPEVENRFWDLGCLFFWVLEMADYNADEILTVWRDPKFTEESYKTAIIKPPWYPKSLEEYLTKKGYPGLY